MLLESSRTPLCVCKNIHGDRQVHISVAYERAKHVKRELPYTFSVETVQKLQEHQYECTDIEGKVSIGCLEMITEGCFALTPDSRERIVGISLHSKWPPFSIVCKRVEGPLKAK